MLTLVWDGKKFGITSNKLLHSNKSWSLCVKFWLMLVNSTFVRLWKGNNFSRLNGSVYCKVSSSWTSFVFIVEAFPFDFFFSTVVNPLKVISLSSVLRCERLILVVEWNSLLLTLLLPVGVLVAWGAGSDLPRLGLLLVFVGDVSAQLRWVVVCCLAAVSWLVTLSRSACVLIGISAPWRVSYKYTDLCYKLLSTDWF